MPKNYSAYVRYILINRALSNGGRASLKKLKEACERALDIYPLGTRTIEKDIELMRKDSNLGFNAPIEYDYSSREYYYADPDYSIDKTSLSDEEIISLVFAAQLLEQFKDMEVFRTFRGTVQRLIDAAEVYAEGMGKGLQDKIEFEHVPEVKGSEYLDEIMESLSENTVLEISYQSFYSDSENTHVIHPYYLKEYRNRWYLIGYHDKFEGIRTYGLDRIKSMNQLKEHDFKESGFVAQEFYKHIVGVTALDGDPMEIKISATREQALYLRTQPLHDSQEIVEENDQEVIFKFHLIPTFEFRSQILGWGNQVKVLEPAEFREEIIESLRLSLGRY